MLGAGAGGILTVQIGLHSVIWLPTDHQNQPMYEGCRQNLRHIRRSDMAS